MIAIVVIVVIVVIIVIMISHIGNIDNNNNGGRICMASLHRPCLPVAGGEVSLLAPAVQGLPQIRIVRGKQTDKSNKPYTLVRHVCQY